MANIYYPQGSRILQRNTVSSSYYEEVISVLPNVVFFFNSGSQLDWISSSVFSLTASMAVSASYAPGASSISASYATTASFALNGGGSTPVSTSFTSVIVICGGFTPYSLGADPAEIPIPYNPNDGTSSITWDIKRVDLRVAVAGGAPYLKVEKSTSTASFSASLVNTIYLQTGSYQTSSIISGQTVQSGNKIRMNIENLGTATGWTLTTHLKQQ